jgi:hypothetical protein
MKKITFRFVFFLAIAAFLSSCFSIPKTFKLVIDEHNPPEQNATVTFINDTENGWFALNTWNAVDIWDSLYQEKSISSKDKAELIVPAGANSFRFDMRFTFSGRYSSTTYRVDDVGVSYNLEAGEKYEIKGRYKALGFLGLGGYEFYVGIYNAKNGSKPLDEWMIGSSK